MTVSHYSAAHNYSVKVSIVIPHLRGIEILRACLSSIFQSSFQNFEIILVDNASSDGSREMVAAEFPAVKQILLDRNRGYAGGCNAGISVSRGQYILLLNDDTVLESEAIAALVKVLDGDEAIAGAQPKLLNINEPSHFDYSGACGGLIDIFGYPFAFGRTFMFMEEDQGQYDHISNIFWACGTAAMIRSSALEEVGLLDEEFFAHMEEIDLAWRLHLAGFRLVRAPDAVVYHHSGHTLPNTERWKMYLNHRNSIICLWKNYSLQQLVWILPLRIIFEWGIIIYSLLRGDFRRGPAALEVQFKLPFLLWQFLHKRRQVQKVRRVSDRQVMKRMYRGSVIIQHFVLKKNKTTQILHRNELR